MASSNAQSHASSSSAFVSGNLFDGVNLNAHEIYAAGVNKALAMGRQSLREALMSNDEWKQYADDIVLEWDGSGFSYLIDSADPAVAQAIYDLEFGTEDRAPHPVLRRLAARLGREASVAVARAMGGVTGLGK